MSNCKLCGTPKEEHYDGSQCPMGKDTWSSTQLFTPKLSSPAGETPDHIGDVNEPVPEPVPTGGAAEPVCEHCGFTEMAHPISYCLAFQPPSAPEAAAAGEKCGKQGEYDDSLSCTLDVGHKGYCHDESRSTGENLAGWSGAGDNEVAAPIAPAADELTTALRRGLAEAAMSLHTVAEQAGREAELKHMDQVRGYANSRANAADAALARAEEYRKGANRG